MNNWEQHIPHMHTLFWMGVAIIVLRKLTPFVNAIVSAISEKKADGTRGEISIKRIIPFIFTLLVCYMVVGCMHSGREFNTTAFWRLLFFIALSTTVITVAQANGFLDKISILKGKVIETRSEETNINKKTEQTMQQPAVT